MGQYYYVYTKKGDKEKVYNRQVDGEYTFAKLTEHSWWFNPFVNTICHKIHHKPMQIAWVGDYADEVENFGLYEKVWGENVKAYGVSEAQVTLDDKFLVNHTQGLYIDCNEYYDKCVDEKDFSWCIHPLPLLTAVGNGLGGGDYRGVSEEYVGSWANNLISVENKAPLNFKKICPKFVE